MQTLIKLKNEELGQTVVYSYMKLQSQPSTLTAKQSPVVARNLYPWVLGQTTYFMHICRSLFTCNFVSYTTTSEPTSAGIVPGIAATSGVVIIAAIVIVVTIITVFLVRKKMKERWVVAFTKELINSHVLQIRSPILDSIVIVTLQL